MDEKFFKVFTGNSNKSFAEGVCKNLGVELGQLELNRFADGEIRIEVKENVRGADVFVIQSCSPPVNEYYMELFLLLESCCTLGISLF